MKYEIGDRVVVAQGVFAVKARVASVPGFGKLGVTLKKGGVVMIFQENEVFPLYRYVDAPAEMVAVGMVPQGAKLIQPLMFDKKK